MNSVTLYSNGTAVISREYELKSEEPLHISIPVRKTDLDDVISSLCVFGDVTVVAPPSYTPTNAQETTLTLHAATALKEIATKLAGAEVEIHAGGVYSGKLVGMQISKREVDRGTVEQCRIVVLTEKGIQQIEETSITAIRFVEESIQAEINKALRASLGQIRPDSSFVELTIRPNVGEHEAPTSAVVTYATPVAAWKIRYQLRLAEQAAELEGQAVVDNDTDDDWTDTMITTITGEPITFSTDLAEIRRPARSRVNIVADQATGAVMAAPVVMEFMRAGPAAAGAPPGDYAKAARGGSVAGARSSIIMRAIEVQAEARESGDFCVFESPNPVSIGAHKSAIIPLFRTAIGEAAVVLFYKHQDDAQRPFRAVRLKNSASHSLGRGVCEVFVDGDFQGKCVLEPTKPGEECLLIHAKETGVRVFRDVGRMETRRMAIKISGGAAYCEEINCQETLYRIQNSHANPFALEIEHARTWSGSKLTISVTQGDFIAHDIAAGQRIRVALDANGTQSVKVVEESMVQQRFHLDAAWLLGNVIDLNTPKTELSGIQACLELQKKIDGILTEIAEQNQAAKTLDDEQQRLIKLIPNGHTEQANQWRTDLATAETELRKITKAEIPKLNRQLQEARDNLAEALAGLNFTWNDDPTKAREVSSEVTDS